MPVPFLRRKTGSLIALAIASAFAALPVHADEISDLKAQLQILSKRIADLEASQAKTNQAVNQVSTQVANQAQAPVGTALFTAPKALPPSLKTDQEGKEINENNRSGITIFDNDKTTLKMYGIVEATASHDDHQQVTGIPYGGGGLGSGGTKNTGNAGGAPAGSYAGTFGFQTSWFSGNRLGFDFDHDLGNFGSFHDLKIMAKLENEFELPSGTLDTSNGIFNRDAWLGFYSPELGKLTFGRQNTLTRDFTQTWGDPYGTADVTLKEGGYSNVNNFKQLIYYSGGGGGTRMDSAVVWKKKLDDNWVIGLGHSFGFQGAGGSGALGAGVPALGYQNNGQGGPVPGDAKNGATNEISIAYNGLNLGAAKANFNVSYNEVNIDDLPESSILVGGNLVFDNGLRLNTGYIHYTADQGVDNSAGTRTDNAFTLSGSFTADKTVYALGAQTIRVNHAGFIGNGGMGGINLIPFISYIPALSPLNAVASNVASGHKNSLYGSVMYRWDKQTDMYVAADYVKVTGGISVPDAQSNGTNLSGNPALGIDHEIELALGVRYKF
ncbi:MAG: porin [Burkholderiaceae bacterium]|nr:porin [Burkholderiaceae bacterium]